MSGDKHNGIDWQSELKARLEAYEKRTGRNISGKKDPEESEISSPAEEDSGAEAAAEESAEELVEEFEEASIIEEDPGEFSGEESSLEIELTEDGDDEEELDYESEPDFLAVLDGMDDEEDADSFLFRERLSRGNDDEEDSDGDFLDESGDGELEEEDSYFDETREENVTEEPGAEPVVKVVNIEEFRMDSSVEEGFEPLKEEPPLGHEDEYTPLEEEEEEVPKEIIVSRLLSGTVDIVIAVITAAGFMEIAAWKLSRNFFDVGILKWIGILAVFFYILNSLYFLTLVRQTPGMQLTELKLIPGKGRKNLSFSPVLIRTLSFFPSALCVTGLVWAFFDYQARCLHDIISGTRVVSTRN